MQNSEQNVKIMEKHYINYDFLRLLAAFFVVMLHLSAKLITDVPDNVSSLENYDGIAFLSLICRTGVPLFVMISGAFLLDPEKNISDSTIFKRYIPRAVILFLVWSFFYALLAQKFFSGFRAIGIDAWFLLDKEKFRTDILLGHYHLWYMYMLVGLYLLTPILRIITKNASKGQLIYLASLCILVTSIVKLNEGVFKIPILDKIMDKSAFFLPLGYVGYYVAGYVIRKIENKKILSILLLIASGFAIYYSHVWNMEAARNMGSEMSLVLYSNFSPAVYIFSLAIFTLFSGFKSINFHKYQNEIIRDISKYTLIVYMVHPFVIWLCEFAKITQDVFKWETLLVNSAIVYSISILIAAIINMPNKLIATMIHRHT